MKPQDFDSIPIADGVAYIDVSAALPRHPTKRWPRRKLPIRRLYVHHSGAAGQPGIEGAVNCADYTLHARDGWAGMPYHWWLPEAPLYDVEGRALVLLVNHLDVISNHTGGLNQDGEGIGLQGNKTRAPLTDHQNHTLDALLSWRLSQLQSLDPQHPIGWHSIAHVFGGRSKPSCPGTFGEEWIRAWLTARGMPIPGAANA